MGKFGGYKGECFEPKKFYQFMLENGKISKESLDALKQEIKEDMPEWIATMKRYDDPGIEDLEEIWG